MLQNDQKMPQNTPELLQNISSILRSIWGNSKWLRNATKQLPAIRNGREMPQNDCKSLKNGCKMIYHSVGQPILHLFIGLLTY